MKSSHDCSSTRRGRAHPQTEGFTLAELLVVLAVIVLLATLLLPGLAKAKGKSDSAVCQNNLRQLQLGWLMYAHEHHDEPPPNRISHARGFSESLPGSWVLGNAKRDTNTANIQTGVLFRFVNSSEIYRCPSDKAAVGPFKGLRRTRAYSMNAFLNTGMDGMEFVPGCGWLESSLIERVEALREQPREPAGKTRLSELIHPPPEKVFVFLDVNERAIDSGAFNLHPHLQAWEHMPSDRHQQGGNLSFADGHVEHYRWRYRKIYTNDHQFVANELDLADFNRLAAGMPFRR